MRLLFLFPLLQVFHALDVSNLIPKISVDNSPCKSCKVLVESFKKGLERTKNDHFGGGNTEWEEKNLLTYSASEIRFVEILDSLCAETSENQDMCFHLAGEYEHHLKEWWENGRLADLYQWFCVDKLKACCPPKHYGPDCLPCKGYPNVCNTHGTCEGDGTRKGNGLCKCNSGYGGDNCDQCKNNYYTTFKNDIFTCKKCHKSCKNGCTDSGPIGCKECKDGWKYTDETKGCVDINECLEQDVCVVQQFCVNNEGSYSCLNCDKSCKNCYGEGNKMCYNCAPGYTMKNKICIDTSESYEVEEKPKFQNTTISVSDLPSEYMVNTRRKNSDQSPYITYTGLGIATVIIFRINTTIASILGVFIAMYIIINEYQMNELYK